MKDYSKEIEFVKEFLALLKRHGATFSGDEYDGSIGLTFGKDELRISQYEDGKVDFHLDEDWRNPEIEPIGRRVFADYPHRGDMGYFWYIRCEIYDDGRVRWIVGETGRVNTPMMLERDRELVNREVEVREEDIYGRTNP